MKILYTFCLLSLFFLLGCHKSNVTETSNKHKSDSCDLEFSSGFDMLKNRKGVLVYTDTLMTLKQTFSPAYFIMNYEDDSLYLPLKICNSSSLKLPKIKLRDSIAVTFTGKVQLLSAVVSADATNLVMVLYSIGTIDNN